MRFLVRDDVCRIEELWMLEVTDCARALVRAENSRSKEWLMQTSAYDRICVSALIVRIQERIAEESECLSRGNRTLRSMASFSAITIG
jgi:hypothetical protein